MFENYKFNFKEYPELLKYYQEYRKLRRKVVKYSMSNTTLAANKLMDAIEENEKYARTVLAPMVFDTFKKINPVLYNGDKEYHVKWEKYFGYDFNLLNDEMKDELAGLLDGNYIYMLPMKFYND